MCVCIIYIHRKRFTFVGGRLAYTDACATFPIAHAHRQRTWQADTEYRFEEDGSVHVYFPITPCASRTVYRSIGDSPFVLLIKSYSGHSAAVWLAFACRAHTTCKPGRLPASSTARPRSPCPFQPKRSTGPGATHTVHAD